MAIMAVHHPVPKLSISVAVLGGVVAALFGVGAVVDGDDTTVPVEQVVAAPSPSVGLGFILSDAFPSELVSPSLPSGWGFILSDAFPSELVSPSPPSGWGFIFSEAFPSDRVVAD